jgi:hypothetical protein
MGSTRGAIYPHSHRSLFAFSREGGFATAETMLETIESTRLEVISAVFKLRHYPVVGSFD